MLADINLQTKAPEISQNLIGMKFPMALTPTAAKMVATPSKFDASVLSQFFLQKSYAPGGMQWGYFLTGIAFLAAAAGYAAWQYAGSREY